MPYAIKDIRTSIEHLFDKSSSERSEADLELLSEFRAALNSGVVRVVDFDRGHWTANVWVRKGIALHTRLGHLIDTSEALQSTSSEFDTIPMRRFTLEDEIRVPPGGTTVRDGSYFGPRVVCMPPSFINIGVYIGEGTVIDSHVSIGACTQIGKRVAINPGVQIGGVVSPADALPTIIGDDAILGGQCGIYDGVMVSAGSVLAAGTILTRQSVLHDIRRKETHRGRPGQSLVVPAGAIVVAGSRFLDKGAGIGSGLLVNVPLIAGYRDDPDLGEFFMQDLLA